MKALLEQISRCTLCEHALPHGVRPVVSVSRHSKILIIGQAPGRKVHASGIPWDDKSGEQLRSWLGVSKEQFYNTRLFGIVPMGFCYPGKGKSGDLPPRAECAPRWHGHLSLQMKKVELTVLIGAYAQRYYLRNRAAENLTETVRNYASYLPLYFPIVHPSPRNGIWLRKNKWFEEEVIPALRKNVSRIIGE